MNFSRIGLALFVVLSNAGFLYGCDKIVPVVGVRPVVAPAPAFRGRGCDTSDFEPIALSFESGANLADFDDCDADEIPNMVDPCPGVPGRNCEEQQRNCARVTSDIDGEYHNLDLRGCNLSISIARGDILTLPSGFGCATIQVRGGGTLTLAAEEYRHLQLVSDGEIFVQDASLNSVTINSRDLSVDESRIGASELNIEDQVTSTKSEWRASRGTFGHLVDERSLWESSDFSGAQSGSTFTARSSYLSGSNFRNFTSEWANTTVHHGEVSLRGGTISASEVIGTRVVALASVTFFGSRLGAPSMLPTVLIGPNTSNFQRVGVSPQLRIVGGALTNANFSGGNIFAQDVAVIDTVWRNVASLVGVNADFGETSFCSPIRVQLEDCEIAASVECIAAFLPNSCDSRTTALSGTCVFQDDAPFCGDLDSERAPQSVAP